MLSDFVKENLDISTVILAALLLLFILYLIFKQFQKVRPASNNGDNNYLPIIETNNDAIEDHSIEIYDNSFNSNILSNQDNLSVAPHSNEITYVNIPLDAALTNKPVILNWDEICVSVKNWIPYPTYLYHYTSIDNAREIVRDKVLRSFQPKVQIFPVGVYFTALSPHFNYLTIIINNYIHYSKSYVEKVECAIAIDMRELKFEKILDKKYGRDVWRYPNDINLESVKFKIVLR